MHYRLYLLLLLLPNRFYGQIFQNKNFEQTQNEWVFNAEFVRVNKIKSINGRFTFKFKGVPLRETNYWQIFEFDTLGRIHRSYETRQDDGTRDTIWTNYFYNDKNLLIYKSVGNEQDLTFITTVHDQEGRVIAIEEFQRKRDFTGLHITKELKRETFLYEQIEDKLLKTRMNSFGTKVSIETPFYNENGVLERLENRYVSTGEGTISEFHFDQKNNLISKVDLTSKQRLEMEKWEFSYDDFDNLKEKKYFHNGKLKQETQFIYNETTHLPTAILMQENGSSNITILRIKEYEYF